MIIALQTARAGSKSVKNKNIIPIKGKPLYQHNLESALKSKMIDKVFVSTNCEFILNNQIQGVSFINRPEHLCGDKSLHQDVMKHAIKHIEEKEKIKIEYLVLLLGNSIIKDYKKIDEAIEILNMNKGLDSVITVSEFNMFNPHRAFIIKDGLLDNYMNSFSFNDKEDSNDKNCFGNFYYLNGEFQVMKRNSIFENGPGPFRWMGNNIYPLVLDGNMELDAEWQIRFIKGER